MEISKINHSIESFGRYLNKINSKRKKRRKKRKKVKRNDLFYTLWILIIYDDFLFYRNL